MLKNEARWLGGRMAALDAARLFPLLNVGSSTRQFRESDQPWIEEEIFQPLRRRSGKVVHLDLKPDDGVDIVGDLNDPATLREIEARGIRSVFCSNMLEHVIDRVATTKRLASLVAPGGYLVLSVPNAFPYHPDPIDTMFRPDVWELAALFPGLRPIDGEVVPCGTVLGLMDRNVMRLSSKVLGMVTSPRRSGARSGPGLVQWLNPWILKQFRATCLVLERPVASR